MWYHLTNKRNNKTRIHNMSDRFEVSGEIKRIGKVENISNQFYKQSFLIESPGQYPKIYKFECHREDCKMLDSMAVGDSVDVSFNIRCNKSQKGVYFTNLQAWRVNKLSVDDRSEPSFAAVDSKPKTRAEEAFEDTEECPF